MFALPRMEKDATAVHPMGIRHLILIKSQDLPMGY
jgi:hypothetical protein